MASQYVTPLGRRSRITQPPRDVDSFFAESELHIRRLRVPRHDRSAHSAYRCAAIAPMTASGASAATKCPTPAMSVDQSCGQWEQVEGLIPRFPLGLRRVPLVTDVGMRRVQEHESPNPLRGQPRHNGAHRGADVVTHDDSLVDADRVEQFENVGGKGPFARRVQWIPAGFVRVPEAIEIRGDASANLRGAGQDVSIVEPQPGPAVQENDAGAISGRDEVHPAASQGRELVDQPDLPHPEGPVVVQSGCLLAYAAS